MEHKKEIKLNYIVYHADCSDAITGLWCCNTYEEIQHTYTYPCKAGSDPTELFQDMDVLFIDICPSVDYILKLVNSAKKIVILDHHKSSQVALENNKELLDKYDNLKIIFDMDRSGCQLAWDYFFGDKERPFFVDYVADRDLWQWKLPMSKEINNALFELDYFNPKDFSKLNDLYKSTNTNLEEIKNKLIEHGKFIDHLNKKEIYSSINRSIEGIMIVGDQTYRIWLSDNIKHRSEVGALLCDKVFKDNTLPAFSAIWKYNITTDEWFISMRGKGLVDLSVVAKQFINGGGHKNASGFTIKNLKDCFIIIG